MMLSITLLSAISALSVTSGEETSVSSTNGQSPDICNASCSIDSASGKELCKFTAKINVHSSELGYFQFEECGDVTNPTLGMEVGKTYVFDQADRSNHYHPLGFAYYPDGAHAGVDELEPGIVPPGSSSTCDGSMSCPAPMYYVDNQYLGIYSNNADFVGATENEDNFGLDDYEPKFFHPLTEWAGYGKFQVFLKFDLDTDYTKDMFYFCHIHQYMTGRIKLLRDGEPIQSDADLPELGYEYEKPEAHDQVCGTYGLDEFQLPHKECPGRFVCDATAENEGLAQFSKCVDSMNCAMMSGMTTSVKGSESEVALFIHQMIPHHQNAVNMAKALLKTDKLNCEDISDDESPDCAMEVMLREIINGQNAQIQKMRWILDENSYPQKNDCVVEMSPVTASSASIKNASSSAKISSAAFATIISLAYFLFH